ncbi:MAG: 4-(cytidine 5'-diphospho)-2-C-methyl-D-erythritol kinase [Dehalococcoidales bacterium]
MLKVKAPAKINLTLEVLAKRADGYHEIRSVVQSVALYDTLYFEDGPGIEFQCDMPEWAVEKSLLNKAVSLLQGATGCQKGAGIRIEKRIPLTAGLGGDSSDAAALLRGLNELWGLKLSTKKRQQIAANLGSDVNFFLHGGTALVEGKGEKITPLPALPKMWVVLVAPDVPNAPGKTGRMYGALKPGHFTDGKLTEKFVNNLHKNVTFDASMLFNTFENVAGDIFPGLKVYQEHLIKLGARNVHLAGSGPALFTMFKDKAQAEDFYARCEGQKMQAYLAETL